MRAIRGGLAALTLLLSAASVVAQERECILIKVIAETVQEATDSKGRKTRKVLAAQKVNPGEVVLYTVSATNVCDHPIERVSIVTPVPEHMTYIANSAIGPGTAVAFSIDGGFQYGTPNSLMLPVAGGEQRQATPHRYTHIRWLMSKPLKPGAVAFARFRAVFER